MVILLCQLLLIREKILAVRETARRNESTAEGVLVIEIHPFHQVDVSLDHSFVLHLDWISFRLLSLCLHLFNLHFFFLFLFALICHFGVST